MPLELTIEAVVDAGADVLAVTARDSDGNEYAAAGWVSHTTNYYPPEDYAEFYIDANGEWAQLAAGAQPPDGAITSTHLVDGAQPRAMTAAEIGAYALELVLEQNPQLAAAPDPAPIAFQAPAPVTVDVS